MTWHSRYSAIADVDTLSDDVYWLREQEGSGLEHVTTHNIQKQEYASMPQELAH
jgi:hypothetical protein